MASLASVQTQIKPIHQVKVDAAPLTEEEVLTEEYIALYQQYEAKGVKELLAKMEATKKKLQSIANEQLQPDDEAVFESPSGEVEFGKCSMTREVTNKTGLLEFLAVKHGVAAVESVIKIGLTELGKILSDKEMEPYITSKPGTRSLREVRLS
jgi:hypothetical protein